MSATLMGAVFYLPLPTSEKMVMCALADHVSEDRISVWPGNERLAVKSSLSVRQVRRVLSSLESDGWIARVKYPSGGRGRAVEWVINLARVYQEARECGWTQVTTKGVTFPRNPDTGDTLSGAEDERETRSPVTAKEDTERETRTPVTVKEDMGDPPTIMNHHLQPSGTALSPQSVDDHAETVSVVLPSGDALPARARPRDDLFEAVATVCYGGWDRLTSTERSLANKACKELRAVGATPDDVYSRAEAYVRWRGDIDAIPTPPTLVKYWSRLASPVQRIPRHEIDALAEEQFMGLRMAEAERRERERLAEEAARSAVTSDRQLGDGHPPPTWLSDQHPREEGESVRDYIRRLNAMTREAG